MKEWPGGGGGVGTVVPVAGAFFGSVFTNITSY